jgi:beta-N-acetylhexosaminidase
VERTAAHRLLWTGFTGRDAAEVNLAFQPGGICLFARNLDPDPRLGPSRCHALIQALQDRWGPLAVSVDQEGGAVARLRDWTGVTPGLRAVWLDGGAEGCRRWGSLWGRGLALLGFNVDFAPVADLWDPAPDSAMGGRCASDDPIETITAVAAFLEGLEAEGVRGCLKHFPGLGGTRLDSHVGLPEIQDEARIARHLIPFRSLAHADRLVMVAHLKIPQSQGLPASFSSRCVAGNPWGVKARWIPDDLEMGGAGGFTWEDKVRNCLLAGHEALLVCQTPGAAQACADAVARMPEDLWAPAAARFRSLRRALPRRTGPFQAEAWKSWIQEVQEEAQPQPGYS